MPSWSEKATESAIDYARERLGIEGLKKQSESFHSLRRGMCGGSGNETMLVSCPVCLCVCVCGGGGGYDTKRVTSVTHCLCQLADCNL